MDPLLFIACINAAVNLARFATGLQDNSKSLLLGVSDDVRALVQEQYRVAIVELEAAGATTDDEERERAIARASDHLRSAQANPRLVPVVRAECAAILAVLSARKGDDGLARHWAGKAVDHHDEAFRSLHGWALRIAAADGSPAAWSPAREAYRFLWWGAGGPIAEMSFRKWSKWRAGRGFPTDQELELWEQHARAVVALADHLGASTHEKAIGLRDRPAMGGGVAFDLPYQPAVPKGRLLLIDPGPHDQD